jgi:hypothetical protein
MLSQQEFNALVSIIYRVPVSPAEVIGLQVIINKLVPKEEEKKEEKKEETNGP